MTDTDYYPEIDPDPEEEEAARPLVIGKDNQLLEDPDAVFQNAIFAADIIHEINDPSSALMRLLADAGIAATVALKNLMQADLFTEDGLDKARHHQNDARRFFEMVLWIVKHRDREGEE